MKNQDIIVDCLKASKSISILNSGGMEYVLIMEFWSDKLIQIKILYLTLRKLLMPSEAANDSWLRTRELELQTTHERGRSRKDSFYLFTGAFPAHLQGVSGAPVFF